MKKWFAVNKLSFNCEKTSFMIFMIFSNWNFNLNISFQTDGAKINRKKENTFLGVIIYERITWRPHITNIIIM